MKTLSCDKCKSISADVSTYGLNDSAIVNLTAKKKKNQYTREIELCFNCVCSIQREYDKLVLCVRKES